jgi:hypothetical protein
MDYKFSILGWNDCYWLFLVLGLFVVGLLANVLLIAGVLKDRPKYFLPFLLVGCVKLVIDVGNEIMRMSKRPILQPSDALLEILMVVTYLYFIICVVSYYVEVRKRQNEAKETVISVVLPTTV